MSPSFVVLLGAVAALRTAGPLSERPASYTIRAKLDAATHQLSGTAVLRWRNTGDVPVGALPLHLYMNAFKNERSTFLRESRWDSPIEIEPGRWGLARVESVHARLGTDEVGATLVVDPVEETLATVRLAAPVPPGATLELTTQFTTRLPQIVSRAGVDKGFYAVAQWFPKVAAYVCDPLCSFRAQAYHADSEFFADFGVYDVTLDLPSDLVVGATGVRTDDRVEGGRRTLAYHAEDVHDFVWTADARFLATIERFDDGSGLPPLTIRVLGRRETTANVPRHLAAARAGLVELGRRLGWYPYSELTIVQPPPGGDEASGMEYPTLFFTDDSPSPASVWLPELVTAHELAHQWFQGMLASDEVDEPWLDEGLAERATAWVLARMQGRAAVVHSMWGHELSYLHGQQSEVRDERADPVATASAAFRDHTSYAEEVYRKAALLLATLEARMGERAFAEALRGYADHGRFRHPRTADFVAAFAVAAPSLRELIADTLHRAATLDYAITAVHSIADKPPRGLFDADGGVKERDDHAASRAHLNAVVIERLGELRTDIVLRAHYADGSHEDRVLPAEAADAPRWRRVELDGPRALVWAELHPNGETPLDSGRWNDARSVRPEPGPRRSLVLSLRLFATLLLSWVGR